MPIYEYRCKDCGKTHEIEHGFHDARPTSCPSCKGHLVRVFHPVGVVFKGSGFHKTDYSASGARKEPVSDKSSSADSKTATKKTSETTTTQKAEKGTSETSTQSKSPDAKPPTGSSKT